MPAKETKQGPCKVTESQTFCGTVQPNSIRIIMPRLLSFSLKMQNFLVNAGLLMGFVVARILADNS